MENISKSVVKKTTCARLPDVAATLETTSVIF